MKKTHLIGRWIKCKTSGKIRSENTAFKAFHMPTYICLTLQKLVLVEFLRIRLVFIRADNICLISLCILTHANILKKQAEYNSLTRPYIEENFAL